MADPAEFNDPDMCLDTPIGDLRVVSMPGGWLGVCIVDPNDPERRTPAIHDVANGGVFGAIYAKRTHEQEARAADYAQGKEARALSGQRDVDDVGDYQKRELDRIQRRTGEVAYVLRGGR